MHMLIGVVIVVVLAMFKMATGTVDSSLEPLHRQKQQAKIEAEQKKLIIEKDLELQAKIQELRQDNRDK